MVAKFKKKYILLVVLVFMFSLNAHAFKQKDIVKLKAPQDTPVRFLLGYDSERGEFVEQCVRVSDMKITSGVDPDARSWFSFVHSMEEVIREEDLDVSVKLNLQFPLAGGSVSAKFQQFNFNKNKLEQGMLVGTFRDEVRPEFISPNSKIVFNQRGEMALKKAVEKANPRKFRKECGDSVVVAIQKDRHIYLRGSVSKSNSQSERQRELDLKLSARYLLSSFDSSVSLSENEKNRAENFKVDIKLTTSGNALLKNATNLKQAKKAWRNFTERPLSETQTISNFYVVPYEDLLPKSEFNIGVSRRNMNKLNKILNGVYVLDGAIARVKSKVRKAESKKERGSLKIRAANLSAELRQIRKWVVSQNGCISKKADSRVCKNLFERFSNFDKSQSYGINEFYKLATRGTYKKCDGFPITNPSGRTECKVCPIGKQPLFINGKNGACGYLPKSKVASNAKRLWIDDLKTSRSISLEAGVMNSVAEYPNHCNKNNKKCDKPMAQKLCADAGLGKLLDYQLWTPGGLGVISAKPRTIYRDGKQCKKDSGNFTEKSCKTFLYIDCAIN